MDHLEKGDLVYLYTGRGPSSESLHLGHIIQFQFNKYLQEAFRCPLVIQLSNDEKFMFKKNLTIDQVEQMTIENAKDILACGFDPELTFIFSDLDYVGHMYRPIIRLLKHISSHEESKIYGFDGKSPAGYFTWPSIQSAPSFSCAFPAFFGPPYRDTTNGNVLVGPEKPWNGAEKEPEEKDANKKKNKKQKKSNALQDADPSLELNKKFAVPCLIPCAIDQDPYFRMCRDHASAVGCPPPFTLLSKFVPALTGGATKMSASVKAVAQTLIGTEGAASSSSSSSAAPAPAPAAGSPTSIFMNDSNAQIKRAENSMFSIGQDNKQDQVEHGAKIKDLSRDAAYQYLRIFDFETPDEVLDEMGQKYLNGTPGETDMSKMVLSGTIKSRLVDVLWNMAHEHQVRRAAITDEQVRQMMSIRPLRIRKLADILAEEETQQKSTEEAEKKEETTEEQKHE